ncbi:MAG TPA: sugar ABC transporter ATP-binding protein [Gemmatimonadales bacterium]|nr:sugar ABC transporter ATP-binding protein [Gemmatimonadales bacterium]
MTPPAPSPTPAPPLLALRAVTKRFPGVVALDAVDFDAHAGRVHALVGENGAGKSTLLKVVAGAERPDAGTLALGGAPVSFGAPRDALSAGVTVMYQELSLVPQLRADANIFLGMEPGRHGLLDRHAAAARAGEVLRSLGADFDPATPAGDLSVAEQQLVELARALVRDARLIALDEPTAALSLVETDRLFEQVRRLCARGIAVIFVSHRLEEVRRIADEITVLRDGRRVFAGPAAGIDDAGLIRHMVGRDVEYARLRAARGAPGDPLLEVRSLGSRGRFSDVSLAVRRGEIVGLAGLVGAGRTEVARCLAGADPHDAGAMALAGAPYRPASPREAIARGVVFLPEDRKTQGLVLGMNVRENVTLAALGRFARRGVIRARAEREAATRQTRAVELRPPDIEREAGTLSGGNQQKVVLAKWLLVDADVLIFDEPTRGVDVAAKVELHQLIRGLADAGKAVVVISSELPEILALADRVVVMREGRVSGELPAAGATAEGILALALPASHAA